MFISHLQETCHFQRKKSNIAPDNIIVSPPMFRKSSIHITQKLSWPMLNKYLRSHFSYTSLCLKLHFWEPVDEVEKGLTMIGCPDTCKRQARVAKGLRGFPSAQCSIDPLLLNTYFMTSSILHENSHKPPCQWILGTAFVLKH